MGVCMKVNRTKTNLYVTLPVLAQVGVFRIKTQHINVYDLLQQQ